MWIEKSYLICPRCNLYVRKRPRSRRGEIPFPRVNVDEKDIRD